MLMALFSSLGWHVLTLDHRAAHPQAVWAHEQQHAKILGQKQQQAEATSSKEDLKYWLRQC
jgi:hypothetical protein